MKNEKKPLRKSLKKDEIKAEPSRIQKMLSEMGIASRRQVERWISEGRIQVNGQVAKLGDKVSPLDQIQIDGRILRRPEAEAPITRVIAYHKTAGEICTRKDPEKRPTVFQNLPKLRGQRWVSIGRLDLNTSGLLLFTNNGELAHRLMHPSMKIEREYAVRVLGKVDEEMLTKLTHGVMLEDGMARFEHIVNSGGDGANHWYHVLVTEGRNRLVRRLWESQGVQVSRLMRVRFGPIFLEKNMRPNKATDITGKLLEELIAFSKDEEQSLITENRRHPATRSRDPS
jgi:23S rRNA pseudouridine2605 synthase